MNLRPAIAEDFDSLIVLHDDAFEGGLDAIPELDRGQWWLLWTDSSPIGFCGIHPSRVYKRTGYLCRAGIDFEYRGRGLHKRLISVRERWAKKNGMDWMITDTHLHNCASSNALIRAGYRLWKPRKRQLWASYRNALYWWKKLSA